MHKSCLTQEVRPPVTAKERVKSLSWRLDIVEHNRHMSDDCRREAKELSHSQFLLKTRGNSFAIVNEMLKI
jgi:hypothetical protein